MATNGHNGEVLAGLIFQALTGQSANLPEVDLNGDLYTIPWSLEHSVYQPVQKIDAATITEKKVGGNGIFDVIMSGLDAHLDAQFKLGRIPQSEYAKTYVALTAAALQNAVQFALGQDQAFWMAAKAQADAITARTQNEIARIQAQFQRSQYALGVMKLATEDATYANQDIQAKNILPQQEKLLMEQVESARAQTMDSRSTAGGGGPIGGVIGSQKKLYDQQIISYKEDVKFKNAKLFVDGWVALKTIDEATAIPVAMDGTNIDPIFDAAKARATAI